MRLRFLAPAVVAILALSLTGCVTNAGPSTSPSAVVSVAPDAVAIALLPADVASSGRLTVASDASYAPNEFKDAEGNAIGWEIELSAAIAAKLGLTAEVSQATFDNIIPSIVGGKFDLGISSFTDTLEREQQVDFVNYFTAGNQWATAAGKTIDPDNACGLTVSAMTGGTQAVDELPARSAECVAAGKAPLEILQFDDNAAATNAAVLGKADAVSADSPVTLYAVAQSKGKLVTAGATFDAAPYGIVLAKDSGLAPAIQAALQALVADGTYGKILTAWGVSDGALATITINVAFQTAK
jgi:polar amino acid transport system substrate-binding protein